MIEANPTSNVYIGPLESHSEHPIFRWSPPDWVEEKEWNRYKIRVGEKPLQVLVNTDDPGIMPTSLRMEFDLLRRAALSHDGASAESAAAWVERFRAAGKVEFEEKHASVFAAPS